VGDFLILRAVRQSGGKAVAVGDPAILEAVRDCARRDGLLLCPEGGATLAAYRQSIESGEVDPGETAVLFNCATGLKYPMPPAANALDCHEAVDFDTLLSSP
jgi:threonine synthase